MFSLCSSLHSHGILIFIVFLSLTSSNGVDNRYMTCLSSLFSCGDYISDVGYPFWGNGRPQYCGHPELQLQCLNSTKTGTSPVLKLGRENKDLYNILNINYSHLNMNYGNSITIKLQVYDITAADDIPCTSNMTELTKVFRFSPSVNNITLYYNCTSSIEGMVSSSVPCFTPSNRYQTNYISDGAIYNNVPCNTTVVPVSTREADLNYSANSTLSDFIPQGFEVNYEYSSECLRCTNSNGICGSSDNSDFVCFYDNSASRKSHKLIIVVGSVSLTVGIGIMLIVMITCLGTRRTARKFAVFWKSEAAKCPNVNAFLQIYGSFALTSY